MGAHLVLCSVCVSGNTEPLVGNALKLWNVYLLFEIPKNIYGVILLWRHIFTGGELKAPSLVSNTTSDDCILPKGNVISFL